MKFAQMEEYPHVQQPTLEVLREGYAMKGKWKKDFFNNNNPIKLKQIFSLFKIILAFSFYKNPLLGKGKELVLLSC